MPTLHRNHVCCNSCCSYVSYKCVALFRHCLLLISAVGASGLLCVVIVPPWVFDAQRTTRDLMHFADNVGPNQRAHLCSLIWAFSVCRHILQYPLLMRRLIRACVVCKLHKGLFVRCASFLFVSPPTHYNVTMSSHVPECDRKVLPNLLYIITG